MIFGLVSKLIGKRFAPCYAQQTYWQPVYVKQKVAQQQPHSENECQRSVNNFWTCKQRNWEVICLLLSIINLLAAFIAETENDTVTAPFRK